jgi:diguanylate cyclase (GGDEF)-like protein
LVEGLLEETSQPLLRENLLPRLLSIRPTDFEGVMQIARETPFIAARLLSMANSAALGVANEVRTVERAVSLIGSRRARSLALAAGMRSFMWKLGLSQPVRDALLNNSVLRALLARRFCQIVDPTRADEAYAAALMLDIGLPVLIARDETPYAAVVTAGGRTDTLVRDECLHFGVDHGIIGAAMLARWNVAPSVRSLVIQHHAAPGQDELFDTDPCCSVRLATFFAGLLPHVFESSTPWQSSWMRAMHHMFLGAHFESLDAVLEAVSAEAHESLASGEGEALDSRQLTMRLVEELSCDTEMMVANLCHMEQLLTEAQAGSRDLKFQAFTDALTKLLNRNGFLSLSQRRMTAAASGPGAKGLSCMLCDLNGFKAINDVHGHAAGDQALRGYAKILRMCCPPETVIGRLGGDEFAIITIGASRADATALAERIERQTRTQAMRVSPELTLNLSASIGGIYVEAPSRNLEPTALLKAADAAMYEQKRTGKAGICFRSVNIEA